jgi:Domain of unknown function (DUF4124)
MKSTLLIIGLLFSAQLAAGVYKCTDSKGNKIYRAIPCAEGQSNVELDVRTGSATDLNAKENAVVTSQQEQEAIEAQKKLEEEQKLKKLEELKQSAAEESAKNQFLIKSNTGKYSPFAIPPYKYDDLPTFVKPYQNRLPDIEKLRRLAAEKALATGQCGRVESVELSEKSTKSALVTLVDCSTAQKFYYTEQELGN